MEKTKRQARLIVRALKKWTWRIKIAGSIRRGVKDPRDIDIVIIPQNKAAKAKIIKWLFNQGTFISKGEKRVSVQLYRSRAQTWDIKLDIFFTNGKSWGATLMYATGPAGGNIWNRSLAKSKGYLLNQYGLFNRKTGKQIPVYSERTLYRALGKSYREPWERGKPR